MSSWPRYAGTVLMLVATIMGCTGPGRRLVISANDQRFLLSDGLSRLMDDPRSGSVTILDLGAKPPKLRSLTEVPCSVIGPPTCVAVTPDERLALVAAAMRTDPDDATRQVPDERVNVIDLAAGRMVQAVTVGRQPSGVAISRDGRFGLVCNRADGTLTVLRINGMKVAVQETVAVCEPEENLSDVAISADGGWALASLNQAPAVLRIPLRDGLPQGDVQRVKVGQGPYALEFLPDGWGAVVAHVGGNSIAILDFEGRQTRIRQTIEVGIQPEGLDVSPRGEWIAVSCMNNTAVPPDAPQRREHSELVLLKRAPCGYVEVQRMAVDPIAQAVVFAPGLDHVVVAGFEDKRLTVYPFVAGRVEPAVQVFSVPGQPCALGVAE